MALNEIPLTFIKENIMDIETTTPATDIVAVDEEEGFGSSDLTKLAIAAAVTTVVILGGQKVMRRVALKLANSETVAAWKAEALEAETAPETPKTEAA